jgi:hypothetical protein
MKSWRVRLLAMLAVAAMLLAVSGPAAMAQSYWGYPDYGYYGGYPDYYNGYPGYYGGYPSYYNGYSGGYYSDPCYGSTDVAELALCSAMY